NSQQIEGYVEVSGTTVSTTSATQRNVSVYSTSTTRFQGKKRLALDFNGPTFGKSETLASTSSRIRGVSAAPPFAGLKRRIALKKARQLQPEANALTNKSTIAAVGATV